MQLLEDVHFSKKAYNLNGACCRLIVRVILLQNRKTAGSIPDEVTEFSNLPNPSRRTVALGLTHDWGEGGERRKAWPTLKTDNFTSNFVPIV
jgi:hypothetical protein